MHVHEEQCDDDSSLPFLPGVEKLGYDGVSAGIWVIRIEVANLGARW